MADVHIWEKGNIHCKAVGLPATVKKAKFNFYKGTDKLGSVDAKLSKESQPEPPPEPPPEQGSDSSGGSSQPEPTSQRAVGGAKTQVARAKYTAPECGPEDAFVKLTYKIELDGAEKEGFIHDVYVWAKTIKIKSLKQEDGAKLPRAKLKIKQQNPKVTGSKGTSELERVTDDNGELEHPLVFPAEANITWQRPFAFKSWEKGTASSGRERHAKLERGFIAKLVFPDPSATPSPDPRPLADQSKPQHVQWVNVDPSVETDPKPEWGSKIKIRVGAVNPATVMLNEDKVFLKAKWDGGNLERATSGPLTEEQVAKGVVLADPDWPAKDKEFTEEKLVTASSKEVEFELELGPTGGDKVVVEVGGTSDCADAKIEIVNWRMLTYEILFPACVSGLLSDEVTLPLAPAVDPPTFVTGFQPETTAWVAERLQKAFIAYYLRASHQVDDDHEDLGKAIVDSAYVKPLKDSYGYSWEDGKPVFAAGSWVRREGMWLAAGNRNNQVTLCHCALSSGRNSASTAPKYESLRGQVTDASLDALELDVTAALGKYAFKNAMGWHVAKPAIDKITWRAVLSEGRNAVYRFLEQKVHPAMSGGVPLTGTITVDDTNVAYPDCNKIKIKVPADAKKWIGALSLSKCPLEITASVCGAYLINGNAGGGKQLMVVARPKTAMAATVCHELGHAMGLTPYPSGDWKVPPPRGLPNLDTIPAGLVYDTNFMHVGTHCAFSISATDRAKPKFGGKNGTCIMYGSGGDEEPPSRDTYCPDCLKYLTARKLNDIRSTWRTRGADDL